MTPPSIVDRLERAVWQRNRHELPAARRGLLEALRVLWCVARDVWEGELTLRAMSLVYTTLLSLIPLFAISFSVLKGFGVHREIEPFLITFLAPLGERSDEIAVRLVEFIDNTSVSVLGYVGFALLFFTVVSLMQKIERAFNHVWHVERDRSFPERIRDYLTLVIVGPTLMFAAAGIWATILGTDVVERIVGAIGLGWLINTLTQALPVLLTILAFTFIYVFVPNTKVQWKPALIGGMVAGISWDLGGLAFAAFVGSSANYSAIYSSFATAIFFLIWINLAWMILLIGGSISFYIQNPPASRSTRALTMSQRTREKLALAIAVNVGRRFYSAEPPYTATSLAEHLGVPLTAVVDVLTALEERGLLLRAGTNADTWMPARAWESVSVRELMSQMRAHGEAGSLQPEAVDDPAIADPWERFERSLGVDSDDVSLRELSLARSTRETRDIPPVDRKTERPVPQETDRSRRRPRDALR